MASPPASQPTEFADLGPADLGLWQELRVELEQGLDGLPDKPEETVDASLRALWQLAAGEPMSVQRAARSALPPLTAEASEQVRLLVHERLAGIPLAHLTGRQAFLDIEMLAGPEALIPRRETELLGRAAVALLHRLAETDPRVVVVDVCTGSGNLAAALAAAEPRAVVYASDLSSEAVDLARRNMTQVGVDERVTLLVGDLLAPFDTDELRGRVDLLTCNPPYISTGRMAAMPDEIVGHEPALAFDGGPLGIRILQRLISEAPRLLRPGGWLAFEVGLGQGPSVEKRLLGSGDYSDVEPVADAAGQTRALLARRRLDP
jgi:release factor glutamine methyltransferase